MLKHPVGTWYVLHFSVTLVRFPLEYCTCREDKLHSSSAISQCMKNGNDDCREEHAALLHPHMNKGIYNIPEMQPSADNNKIDS